MKTLVFVICLASAVIFVACIGKKSRIRTIGGKDYASSEEYVSISKRQKLSGIICVLLLLFALGLPDTPADNDGGVKSTEITPEEKAQQELYDKQAQYEEWIAWKQQQAKEKADEAKAKHEQRRAQERAEREKYQSVSAYQMLNTLRENGFFAKEQFQARYVEISDAYVEDIETNGRRIIVNAGRQSYNNVSGNAVNFDQVMKNAELELYRFFCDVSKAKGKKISSLRKGQWIVLWAKVVEVSDETYFLKVDRIE